MANEEKIATYLISNSTKYLLTTKPEAENVDTLLMFKKHVECPIIDLYDDVLLMNKLGLKSFFTGDQKEKLRQFGQYLCSLTLIDNTELLMTNPTVVLWVSTETEKSLL